MNNHRLLFKEQYLLKTNLRGDFVKAEIKSILLICISIITLTTIAQAQDVQSNTGEQQSHGLQDIVVTVQKRGAAKRAQSVPVSITAFNAESLAQAHLTDLTTLTAAAPNVVLESSGIVKGTANFSIRGFGVVGMVPSMEPSAGVFVNGIYQGISAGSIGDLYDVNSIQILRGPQGT